MKAIVVTDQAAGTAGMKLSERPERKAAQLLAKTTQPMETSRLGTTTLRAAGKVRARIFKASGSSS